MIFVTHHIALFADDTNIFYSHQDINVLLNTINNELQKVNKLSLIQIIHFILFSNREKSLPCTVRINNIENDRFNSTKFLGILIDHKIDWKEHIDLIIQKGIKNHCNNLES